MEPAETGVIGGIRRLQVDALRNLRGIELDTNASIVLVSGSNGAGKTTLLEAIYLLARGRTFRGRKAGPLRSHGAQVMWILGEVQLGSDERLRIALQRDSSGTTRSMDPPSWEDLGPARLPARVKLVSENAQVLLEGDPDLRRRFLDWSLFHVEPRFGRIHKEHRRILAQRNAAVRVGGNGARLWDAPFLESAQLVDRHRRAFIAAWDPIFRRLCEPFPFAVGCEIRYARGWPDGLGLEESLERCRGQEQERGYTMTGPSRADFQIWRDGRRQGFSRGQTKVLVTLLQLAAEQLHLEAGAEPAIFLLDDLESELDDVMAARLWKSLYETRSQIFCTRVGSRLEVGRITEGREVSRFHLEQGRISPVA